MSIPESINERLTQALQEGEADTAEEIALEALQANRASVVRLDGLLGGLGAPYVDREEARQHELQCRREALLGVEDGDLRAVRDECLGVLQRMTAGSRSGS